MTAPVMIPGPPGLRWKETTAAGRTSSPYSFSLASDGSIWCAGLNFGGVFGFPVGQQTYRTDAPIQMPNPAGVLWWRKVLAQTSPSYCFAALDQKGDLWYSGPSPNRGRIAGPWLDFRIGA